MNLGIGFCDVTAQEGFVFLSETTLSVDSKMDGSF